MGLLVFFKEKDESYIASFPKALTKDHIIVVHNLILTMNLPDIYLTRQIKNLLDFRAIEANESELNYLNSVVSPEILNAYLKLKSKNNEFKKLYFAIHLNGMNFIASINHLVFEKEEDFLPLGTDVETFLGFCRVMPKDYSLIEGIKLFQQQLYLDSKKQIIMDDFFIESVSKFLQGEA
jgi:hypothetical protein